MSSALGGPFPVVEIPNCRGKSSASPSAPLASVSASPAVGPTKFHFALNVSDLERSIAFYRILFDVPPAKHHADYAKFELSQPPLVFSLVPNPPASGGTLSHFGLPVGSPEEVRAAAERLAAAGLETSCQQGTVCGYARQDKVWVADPDRNFWEIYVIHEDVDPESVRRAFDGVAPSSTAVSVTAERQAQPVLWEHRILMPLVGRIPYESETIDEVRLVGTFNDRLSEAERAGLLVEALRVLRPGGKLSVHGLVADRPLAAVPQLPGVAGIVQRVPTEEEPLCELAEAGFEAVCVTKLAEAPVFRDGAAEMREIKLEARKPDRPASGALTRAVVYKGPFSAAVDEGQTFRRGEKTSVTPRTWDRLASGASASQFLFIGDPGSDACGCGS
jgi:catechol 2,3-dioxygenase-like lactoylglutathione lyase family enzyme